MSSPGAKVEIGAELSIGDRIRIHRTRKGISQSVLGGLIGRSEDWVSRVERGVLPIDRLSLLLEIMRVLGVRELTDLTGRALALTPGDSLEHPSVPAIRAAINSLPSALGQNLPGDPLTAQQLAERVDEIWMTYEQDVDRYALVGPVLPNLLHEANLTLRRSRGDEETRAVVALVSLYHLLQIYLRRVGEPELARVVADRALMLAESTGDPVLSAASAWNLCSVLTVRGHVAESLDLARSAMDAYAPGEDATAEHVSVYGALHLAAVIAAVRGSNAPAAWDHLRAADEVARRNGEDRNDWRTSFGPCNVAMHGVHLAAEEGDAAEALRLADHVEVNPILPLERRTRYRVEVMASHRLKRDDLGTLFVLQQIATESPEEVRFFPLVRDAVRDLLKRERPTYRAELRSLAAQVGVLE
ncbi:helix-turn-helix domain-containing protein [Embleya sp. AB8]|uniref:helix-turn-helix domain-containing protein n=1 Tax=Embleya sp. AB8 TaxID=3156304 RepID=UPI003C759950